MPLRQILLRYAEIEIPCCAWVISNHGALATVTSATPAVVTVTPVTVMPAVVAMVEAVAAGE